MDGTRKVEASQFRKWNDKQPHPNRLANFLYRWGFDSMAREATLEDSETKTSVAESKQKLVTAEFWFVSSAYWLITKGGSLRGHLEEAKYG